MINEYWYFNTNSLYPIYKKILHLGGRWNRVISKFFFNWSKHLCCLVFRSDTLPCILISQQFLIILIVTFHPGNSLKLVHTEERQIINSIAKRKIDLKNLDRWGRLEMEYILLPTARGVCVCFLPRMALAFPL